MIENQWFKLVRRWRTAGARRRGVTCSNDLRLAAHVDFNLGGTYHNSRRPSGSQGRIVLGPACWIEQGCVLWAFDGSIILGQNVFVGPHAVIYGHGSVEVGDNTLISMHCCIVSSNHTVPKAGCLIREHADTLLPTRIGSDCWIGAGATVLGGVTIGDGCVVGAGSVVTKDLPSNSIAMGTPATIRSSRSI